MDKVWRIVEGATRYEVSDHGDVRGRAGRILKGSLLGHGGGYRAYRLCLDEGGSKWFKAHILVLTAFVGPRPPLHEGCHNNSDRHNNHLRNLRWDTPEGNVLDIVRAGARKGERNQNAILTAAQVIEARTRRARGERLKDLAAEFGVHRVAMSRAVHKRTWAHV